MGGAQEENMGCFTTVNFHFPKPTNNHQNSTLETNIPGGNPALSILHEKGKASTVTSRLNTILTKQILQEENMGDHFYSGEKIVSRLGICTLVQDTLAEGQGRVSPQEKHPSLNEAATHSESTQQLHSSNVSCMA